MALKWMVVCLACCLVFQGSVSAQTVPCMTNRADCQRTGFSSMSVINNHFFCCAPGFSMNFFFNAHCSCTRTSESMSCTKGPRACAGAASISSDGQGNTRCCPAGFGMTTRVTSINGFTSETCICTRGLRGRSSYRIRANGNFNASDIQANWQQKFQNRIRQSMQTLRAEMRRMKNRIASTFGKLFRG